MVGSQGNPSTSDQFKGWIKVPQVLGVQFMVVYQT